MITNLLIKFKVHYIVILFTVFYWVSAFSIRLFHSEIVKHLWDLYSVLIYLLIAINILSLILLVIMLVFRSWNVKYTLILLGINVLTVFVGKYFIYYPVITF